MRGRRRGPPGSAAGAGRRAGASGRPRRRGGRRSRAMTDPGCRARPRRAAVANPPACRARRRGRSGRPRRRVDRWERADAGDRAMGGRGRAEDGSPASPPGPPRPMGRSEGERPWPGHRDSPRGPSPRRGRRGSVGSGIDGRPDPPPALPVARILDGDPAGGQLVAQPVGGGPVPPFAGGRALIRGAPRGRPRARAHLPPAAGRAPGRDPAGRRAPGQRPRWTATARRSADSRRGPARRRRPARRRSRGRRPWPR